MCVIWVDSGIDLRSVGFSALTRQAGCAALKASLLFSIQERIFVTNYLSLDFYYFDKTLLDHLHRLPPTICSVIVRIASTTISYESSPFQKPHKRWEPICHLKDSSKLQQMTWYSDVAWEAEEYRKCGRIVTKRSDLALT